MCVRLGYACISIPKRKENVYTGRTIMLKTMSDRGIEYAKELALQNIKDLCEIIKFNEERGIRFFRITSELFPHMENPRAPPYNMDFAIESLNEAGKLARQFGHRITMHPGQYAQLGSPREEVVAQTFRDLNAHSKILLAMGMRPELGSVMIIHGGGSFGDKKATLERWADNFNKLPVTTQQFVSLENDDYQYSVLDLLPLCERLKIPLCIDFFHHICYGENEFDIFDEKILDRVIKTWRSRGIKPKCHWSNQADGKRKGTHGDYIEELPPKLINFAIKYDCDIMCECKMKDECLMRLLEKHFTKNYTKNGIYWSIKKPN